MSEDLKKKSNSGLGSLKKTKMSTERHKRKVLKNQSASANLMCAQ